MEPTLHDQTLLSTNGDLAERIAFAKSIGNHLVDSFRLRQAIVRTARRYYEEKGIPGAELDQLAPEPTPPPAWRGMPTTGNVKIFALLIDFSDHPHTIDADDIDDALFGKPTNGAPYESLAAYYWRASYNKLDFSGGTTLGWYRAGKKRATIATTKDGREALIKEAIQHFNNQGHDFSQYDNNNNGEIDYFLVFWTGPNTGWGSFWWGYQTRFSDSNFKVDGVSLGKYSWQWESNPVGQAFNPRVAIHETGHALGLPDYYDYDGKVGPDGGVGGADMMDANQFDHNCFSKWMLDWLEPTIVGSGTKTVTLDPSASDTDCVAVWPGLDSGDLFSEYFMVQNRYKAGNDVGLPAEGLMIWHVDAKLDASGNNFVCNNSFSDHKLLRLMEADGEEDIEANRGFDIKDFFVPGDAFGPTTKPSSMAYNGKDTGVEVNDITASNGQMSALIKAGKAGLKLAHAMWVHGHSVEIEYPERLSSQIRRGYYIQVRGKPFKDNWFHYAIPTPVIVDGKRLVVGSVMIRFRSGPGTVIHAVHIYDGETKIASYDGQKLTSQGSFHWPRFDVPKHPLIKWGLGVSIGVKFNDDANLPNNKLLLEISSVGCDFLLET